MQVSSYGKTGQVLRLRSDFLISNCRSGTWSCRHSIWRMANEMRSRTKRHEISRGSRLSWMNRGSIPIKKCVFGLNFCVRSFTENFGEISVCFFFSIQHCTYDEKITACRLPTCRLPTRKLRLQNYTVSSFIKILC